MQEQEAVACLHDARNRLTELGIKPVALVALDRPMIAGRLWLEGGLQVSQAHDLLSAYATEMAAHGLFDGARNQAFPRQLSSTWDRGLSVISAPRSVPRLAAIVQSDPDMDVASVVDALSAAVPHEELIEVAAALCDATGASAALFSGDRIEFASKAAFVQQGATGPFLGLSCLSRQAPDALSRMLLAREGQAVRKEQIGGMTMVCFVRRIGENNLAIAASRFGLTRAELAESESMIAGLSCKESAVRLKISPETVRQRRKVIYRKLGVESCGTAVARILELELPSQPVVPLASPIGSITPASLPPPGELRNSVMRTDTARHLT